MLGEKQAAMHSASSTSKRAYVITMALLLHFLLANAFHHQVFAHLSPRLTRTATDAPSTTTSTQQSNLQELSRERQPMSKSCRAGRIVRVVCVVPSVNVARVDWAWKGDYNNFRRPLDLWTFTRGTLSELDQLSRLKAALKIGIEISESAKNPMPPQTCSVTPFTTAKRTNMDRGHEEQGEDCERSLRSDYPFPS
ncbi:hypothetical protein Fcan01_26329 [Folsomia candida]|uniref:Uncharacterized protein n=1 Tax=Folsomia candida TaxID=158441 RepID=A0A226D140_FOLCA|nr:hypothetical protein Fcan01_26329 [Folsomia candida]